MKKIKIMGMIIMGLMGAGPAFASGEHQGMHEHQGAMHNGMHRDMGEGHMKENMKGPMHQSLLVKKEIDGYSVSFHVIQAPDGLASQGTHHIMVKIEKNAKPVEVLAVNSKVVHPNGQSESKIMMRMGDGFMAAYNLDHQGQHGLMVLFKTNDGSKHFGGIYYPETKEDQ